jgi:outer membrane receptor for Fe3+-dicitrate
MRTKNRGSKYSKMRNLHNFLFDEVIIVTNAGLESKKFTLIVNMNKHTQTIHTGTRCKWWQKSRRPRSSWAEEEAGQTLKTGPVALQESWADDQWRRRCFSHVAQLFGGVD